MTLQCQIVEPSDRAEKDMIGLFGPEFALITSHEHDARSGVQPDIGPSTSRCDDLQSQMSFADFARALQAINLMREGYQRRPQPYY